MSKYGKFNYFSGDRRVVPVVDAWAMTHDPDTVTAYQKPTAIGVHTDWTPGEDSEGEVFVRLGLPSFSISLSPREALALADRLYNVADFIVNGSDTLGA